MEWVQDGDKMMLIDCKYRCDTLEYFPVVGFKVKQESIKHNYSFDNERYNYIYK